MKKCKKKYFKIATSYCFHFKLHYDSTGWGMGLFHWSVFTFYFSSIKVELYLGLPDRVDSDRSSVEAVMDPPLPRPVTELPPRLSLSPGPLLSAARRLASSALLALPEPEAVFLGEKQQVLGSQAMIGQFPRLKSSQ